MIDWFHQLHHFQIQFIIYMANKSKTKAKAPASETCVLPTKEHSTEANIQIVVRRVERNRVSEKLTVDCSVYTSYHYQQGHKAECAIPPLNQEEAEKLAPGSSFQAPSSLCPEGLQGILPRLRTAAVQTFVCVICADTIHERSPGTMMESSPYNSDK